MLSCGFENYIVLIGGQQESPSLHSGSSNRWNASFRTKNCQQGFMVCNQRKFPAIDVLVEFAYSKYES